MPEAPSTSQPGLLRAILDLQSVLNGHLVASNGLQNDEGQPLRMEQMPEARGQRSAAGLRLLPGIPDRGRQSRNRLRELVRPAPSRSRLALAPGCR
jgi:hypothetical protein